MKARHFVYDRLTQEAVASLLADGANSVYAKKSMTSSVEVHPYLVYKMGNDTSEEFSEEREVSRQFFQVWVHDYFDGKTADYDKIDTIITTLKNVFKNAGGVPGIWTTRYLETSQDLDDDTLNTVFRYLRFQLIREDT